MKKWFRDRFIDLAVMCGAERVPSLELVVQLHIEEIKRLEEELAQARADRDIKHARRSEASRRGWEKRRAA